MRTSGYTQGEADKESRRHTDYLKIIALARANDSLQLSPSGTASSVNNKGS